MPIIGIPILESGGNLWKQTNKQTKQGKLNPPLLSLSRSKIQFWKINKQGQSSNEQSNLHIHIHILGLFRPCFQVRDVTKRSLIGKFSKSEPIAVFLVPKILHVLILRPRKSFYGGLGRFS